jgi:hypothetical protein
MGMICRLFAIPPEKAEELARDPSGVHEELTSLSGFKNALSLEKSWHGLHYVLTGSAWEGSPPLNFLAMGGEAVGGTEFGYGPARLLKPASVRAVHEALSAFSEADFARNFDLDALAAAEVYPLIWDEPLEDLQEEYGSYLNALKTFVKSAAETGQSLLITIM